MKEVEEDCLIAMYIVGEGEMDFDKAHLDHFFKVMELIRRVREEIKKSETKGPEKGE